MLQPELFTSGPPKTRIICIDLPHWPLATRLRRTPDRWREPLAVAATVRGRAEVIDLTDAAFAAGSRIGLSVAESRALCPGLLTLPADPLADRRALEALGRWMTRYTPTVATGWDTANGGGKGDAPPVLFLDVTGCERLFGSVRAIVRDIRAALVRFRLPARVAAASTVGAAWALARYRTATSPAASPAALSETRPLSPNETPADRLLRVVRPLPVEALRLDAPTTLTLRRLLLTTVGHVLDLPRDTLPARFGPQLLLRVDQLLGRRPELLVPLAYDPPVEARIAFESVVDSLDTLWLVLHELLRRITADLERRGRGARHVELRCTPDRAHHWPTVVRHVHLTRPSRAAGRLFELLRAASEKLDCGDGFVAVQLKVLRHDAIANAQATLADALPHGVMLTRAKDNALAGDEDAEIDDGKLDNAGIDDGKNDHRANGGVLARIGPRTLPVVPHPSELIANQAMVASQIAQTPGLRYSDDADLSVDPRPESGSSEYLRHRRLGSISLFTPIAASPVRPHRRPTKTEIIPDDPELDRLVDCLRARFGQAAVLRTRLVESYVPERAWHTADAATAGGASVAARRPLRLLPTPAEIRVVAEPSDARDGRPAQFTHDGHVHHLSQVLGPERIAGEWWRNHHKVRDYYDVLDTAGRRFWVFRVVTWPGPDTARVRWFLQGLFA